MTMSGIGSASQALANTGVDQNSWQARMQQTLGPVAQLFGMSTDQLQQELQSGESLHRHRDRQGRLADRPDQPRSSRASSRPSRAGPRRSPTPSSTNIANRIANHHHHHHHGGGTGPHLSATSSTSTNPLSAIDPLQQLLQDLGAASAETRPGATGHRADLVRRHRPPRASLLARPAWIVQAYDAARSRRFVGPPERELAHEGGLRAGARMNRHVGQDHGAAVVGVEEAVDEIVAGAEVELGDAVDRVAARRVARGARRSGCSSTDRCGAAPRAACGSRSSGARTARA